MQKFSLKSNIQIETWPAELSDEELEAAAIEIQRVARGFLARIAFRKMKEQQRARREEAAIKIQKLARGFLAKKELARRRAQRTIEASRRSSSKREIQMDKREAFSESDEDDEEMEISAVLSDIGLGVSMASFEKRDASLSPSRSASGAVKSRKLAKPKMYEPIFLKLIFFARKMRDMKEKEMKPVAQSPKKNLAQRKKTAHGKCILFIPPVT